MSTLDSTRHFDLLNQKDSSHFKILIIGAGSIGSYTALMLAKMGYTKITVVDYDSVDVENIGPQFFKPIQIGKSKVDALYENILEHTGTKITAINKMIDFKDTHSIFGFSSLLNKDTILIMAVDSMKCRSDMFNLWEQCTSMIMLDARMAIQFLTSFAIIKTGVKLTDDVSMKNYRATLYTDSEAIQEPCTNKAIAFTSFIAGGVLAKTIMELSKIYTTKTFKPFSNMQFSIEHFDMINHQLPEYTFKELV